MKRKVKFKRKISKIPISPSTEEFYDEAPFDKELGLLQLSELGNAWRFAAGIGGVLYNHTSGRWLNWDGHRWSEKTGTAYVWRKAEKVVKHIINEAERVDSLTDKKKVMNWAVKSQNKIHIDNMLKLAQTLRRFETYSSDYNKDPWLFSCLNGVLDLRTGKLREHRQEDMITKLCPVEYDEFIDEPDNPNRCNLWYKFLDDVTDGDKNFQRFLQQAAGYSLTGDTSLEIFFLLLSGIKAKKKARTGKSTFIDALISVLGDYAKVVSFETFLQQKYGGGGHRADVARLEGVRLVAAVEMDKGRKLAEGLVKSATGGDKIAAAYKYKDWFEFKPQFKLWLAANDAPKVSDTDEAMWERIIQLPFNHYFSKKERDPEVKKILSNPKIAGPTILFWAVQGCLDWQKNPKTLKKPKAVRQATREYREEMNPLKSFFENCCTFSESSWTPRAAPYDKYTEYCKENGIKFPLRRPEFNKRLEDLGCWQDRKRVMKKQIWVWRGIETE